MFSKRQKYQKDNVSLSNIYKLMLNSSYGKTIEKAHNTKTIIRKSEEELFKVPFS